MRMTGSSTAALGSKCQPLEEIAAFEPRDESLTEGAIFVIALTGRGDCLERTGDKSNPPPERT